MSSLNDYIKFSLDIEDQNIIFKDYFTNFWMMDLNIRLKLPTSNKLAIRWYYLAWYFYTIFRSQIVVF